MIASLLMNLAAFLTAATLAYKVFGFADPADSLAIFFILFFAQAVVSQLALGILGALTPGNLACLNLAILFVVWLVFRNRQCRYPGGAKEAIRGLASDKIAMLCLCAILGFGISKVTVNLLNPPFGWDSLNYHFTFAVEWLKNGNLNIPITVFDDPSPTYYPLNGSLFFLWLMWPFKSVFLADLGQLPFFILAFLSAYGLARKAGLSSKLAFCSAAVFSLIPNYFKQLQIAYVDMMVAGLFLASLNFLFLFSENPSLINTVACAMGMGLLLGTKTVALPYCLLLAVPFLYILARNMRKLYLLAVFLFVVICLGGFSYIRNFIETANPLYPLDMKIWGREIFRGVMEGGIYRARFKPEDYNFGKLFFHEGLGLQTLAFALPGVFLALPAALLKNRAKNRFIVLYFLALPALGYLAYRYAIPLANTRYLYPVIAVAVIAGFYLFKTIGAPGRAIDVFIVLSVLASLPELAKRQELVASFILTFLLLILAPLAIRYQRKRNFFASRIFWVFTAIVLAVFFRAAGEYYKKNEFPGYVKMVKYSGFWPDATRAWAWLNENTAHANIAYAGRPVPLPLYGSGFKNNVYYVSVNKTDPAKLHYFSGSSYKWGSDFRELHRSLEEKNNYRGNADRSVWLGNLSRRNTDYLFIYSLHQTRDLEFPVEDEWARAGPAKFVPVFSNVTIRIYKVIK